MIARFVFIPFLALLATWTLRITSEGGAWAVVKFFPFFYFLLPSSSSSVATGNLPVRES